MPAAAERAAGRGQPGRGQPGRRQPGRRQEAGRAAEAARARRRARALDAGENIKALSLYLGHSDPGFTLRVYTHLMPSSETRTRLAISAMYVKAGHSHSTLASGAAA